MSKKSKPDLNEEQAPASPAATDYVLPLQSPQSEFKLLSDALASPIQGTSSGTRMVAPSSREWYTKAPLSGAGDPRELSVFNSPSSGTRGSMKRRNSRATTSEIGMGLFGEGGERQLRQDDNLFSPKFLQSPEGIPSILSPGDGYRSMGRGNVGIAFKGVDFLDNFDGVQTVSSSSGSKDSFSSSSSSYSPDRVQGNDVGNSIRAENTGRGLRKRKASRKGRGDTADVSPMSDHILLDSDSHDSHANRSSGSSSSDNPGGSRRKARVNGSAAKVDSGTGRFNASPVRNFTNNNPRSVTPLGEGKSGVKCNCKKSKCLKLYCDCFRVSKYCEDCNCVDCNNCVEREAERVIAVNNILERNPDAFAPRIKQDSETMSKGHLSGCHCKKSACLKKYCECFSAAVACSEKCRCMDCRNTSEHVAAMAASRGGSVSVSPPGDQFSSHSANASSEIDEEMLLLAD